MCTRHTVHIAVVITTWRRRARHFLFLVFSTSSFTLLPFSFPFPAVFALQAVESDTSWTAQWRGTSATAAAAIVAISLLVPGTYTRLDLSVWVCVCSSVARLPDLKSQAASSETARKAATAAVSPQGLQFNWSLPGEEAPGGHGVEQRGRQRKREGREMVVLPA